MSYEIWCLDIKYFRSDQIREIKTKTEQSVTRFPSFFFACKTVASLSSFSRNSNNPPRTTLFINKRKKTKLTKFN